jgi:hypothetical protein
MDNSNNRDSNITIYALNRDMVNAINHVILPQYEHEATPIRFHTPAYSSNPNIHAQKGIMVTWQQTMFSKSGNMAEVCANQATDFARIPLDIYLHDHVCDEHMDLQQTLLYRFTFPGSDYLTVLRKINYFDYNTSSMFPGYQNVVAEMHDKAVRRYGEIAI